MGNMCLNLVLKRIPRRGTALVYLSFGSGWLWFDWWMLESLFKLGYRVASAHFVDILYTDEMVRLAAFTNSADSALSGLASWVASLGTRTFAYGQYGDFLLNCPEGAHILMQCDADCPGINLMPGLRIGGVY